MSDFVTPKITRKARKIHRQNIDICFDYLIKRDENKQLIPDIKECMGLGMNWNEIQTLKETLINNWSIYPGQEYYTWSGISDGKYFTMKVSIKIYDIINKYKLWPEWD